MSKTYDLRGVLLTQTRNDIRLNGNLLKLISNHFPNGLHHTISTAIVYSRLADRVRHNLSIKHHSPHEVTLDYEALGERQGRGRLLMDGVNSVGWTAMSPTLTFDIFEGLDIGLDRRGPVMWSLYGRRGASAHTGRIHDVHVGPGERAEP